MLLQTVWSAQCFNLKGFTKSLSKGDGHNLWRKIMQTRAFSMFSSSYLMAVSFLFLAIVDVPAPLKLL